MKRLAPGLLAAAILATAACSDRSPTSPLTSRSSASPASRDVSSSSRLPPPSLAPRPSDGPGPVGTWGGNHVNLTIGMSSGVIEYDCAHGTIDVPFATDATGRFDLPGTHVAESFGPILEDKPPTVHPARYSGSADGRTMTLTVTLTDTGQVLGPFKLTRGTAARIVKCA